MISDEERSKVLLEALPYIKKYSGKIIVVKYGGNAMVNETLMNNVIDDIILLKYFGVKVILVHGGGPEITSLLSKVGKKTEFLDGMRVSDAETAVYAEMVLAGKISKDIVRKLQNKDCKAISLDGSDGGMIRAEEYDNYHGFVGKVRKINTEPLFTLLDAGYVPVVSSTGYDRNGCTYNINADLVASSIASAVKAESLMIMTDTPGILKDKDDTSTLMKKIFVSDVPELMSEGIISGGMIPKANCCVEAIRNGVKKVFIIDGRKPNSIIMETLSDVGIGTMFVE